MSQSDVTNVMIFERLEEMNMRRMIDQGIMLLYCFVTALLVPVDTAFVVGFLGAVLYVSIHNLDLPKWCYAGSTVFLALMSLFCPQLLLFVPFMLYSIISRGAYILAMILASMGGVLWLLGEGILLLGLLMLGCMVSGALAWQTVSYEALEATYRRTQDDSTERNLLLKEKNRNLIEKQDYEIYAATLKERNRIAREIHDNVGHMLSRSILMVGAMRIVQKEPELTQPLKQLEDTLNAAMTSVRESVHDLHDDSVNLREVMEELTETFTFCPVKLDYDMGYDVPREIKYSFIAVVKEGLSNVIKHSDATNVHIVLREHPGIYQLIIEDNGTPDKKETEVSGGIGIQNIRDRVQMMDGMLQIQKEKGFRIHITVPKKVRAA